MEVLFSGNVIFIFFFAMIAIYNYSDLREYQRIAIIYITVYSLALMELIGTKMAFTLLALTIYCFFEILTKDDMKFKILANPLYKVIDCLYLACCQYALGWILLAVLLVNKRIIAIVWGDGLALKIISFLIMAYGISRVLQQKFVIFSFNEMYRLFREFPINKVKFNKKLDDACNILISIEDKTYYERKGYTFLSYDALRCIIKRRKPYSSPREHVQYTYQLGKKFFKNVLKEDRGYSTLPMQLIRSLGIKRGYSCKYRRKLFEFLYAKMFFDGIQKMFDQDKVAKREHLKQYYLYIYFHKVNTFLCDATFSKFLNAFDMQYSRRNKKDIYDCTNEGIFIACMGLSKRANNICEDNIDYYLSAIENVYLDRELICEMVSNMCHKPYDGNYLK